MVALKYNSKYNNYNDNNDHYDSNHTFEKGILKMLGTVGFCDLFHLDNLCIASKIFPISHAL